MNRTPSPTSRLSVAESRRQHAWLAGARQRLLRRADIARRRSILELGAGHGEVAQELAHRSRSSVLALDLHPATTPELPAGSAAGSPAVHWLRAAAHRIPLRDKTCDLVFAQCVWMWLDKPQHVLAEILRVLQPGGVIACLEPDYGGMMEYPPEIAVQDVWCHALRRAGADPHVGRKLPYWFRSAGLDTEVQFHERLHPLDEHRLELLTALPVTDSERSQINAARSAARHAASTAIAHLPFWCVLAGRP